MSQRPCGTGCQNQCLSVPHDCDRRDRQMVVACWWQMGRGHYFGRHGGWRRKTTDCVLMCAADVQPCQCLNIIWGMGAAPRGPRGSACRALNLQLNCQQQLLLCRQAGSNLFRAAAALPADAAGSRWRCTMFRAGMGGLLLLILAMPAGGSCQAKITAPLLPHTPVPLTRAAQSTLGLSEGLGHTPRQHAVGSSGAVMHGGLVVGSCACAAHLTQPWCVCVCGTASFAAGGGAFPVCMHACVPSSAAARHSTGVATRSWQAGTVCAVL